VICLERERGGSFFFSFGVFAKIAKVKATVSLVMSVSSSAWKKNISKN
jgi:hypothetical protein